MAKSKPKAKDPKPPLTLAAVDSRLTTTQAQVLQLALLMKQVTKQLAIESAIVPHPQPMTAKKAHAYGYDCGLRGANEVNCHFSIFAREEFLHAWENGKAEGEAARIDAERKR